MEVYINIKNFGKIREARVNISNFTVFVGNNNSGKTQLMELIYSVIKRMSSMGPDINLPQIGNIDAFHIGQEEVRNLNKWVNKYLEEHADEIIVETFNSDIPIEKIAIEFVPSDSGYELYFLTDRTIEYLLEKSMISQEALTELLLNKDRYYRSLIIKTDMDGRTDSKTSMQFSNGIPIESAKRIETGHVLGEIMGGRSPISSNVLFLPASRMGLMLLYKHYFGNRNQDKDELIRDRNQNPKGITKPVLDFLSFLLNYSYTEGVAKNNRELIDFISADLIEGTIREEGEATIYTPQDQEKDIPIYVASSMVNEVVPVIKALTDSDNVDFLFYDEVETSMHPLKQIEMVKLLNRLNNKGIKLLVSTHSDTMATKINNLLLLSHGDFDLEVTKNILEKNGISLEKDDLLVSENIHVYQFVNDMHGKSIVTELEFRKAPCTGYDFSLFNDSTMSLFEEAKIAMGIKNEDQGR